MDEEDLNFLKKALNNRLIYLDDTSCGFSDDFAIEFAFKDGSIQKSCVAYDTCPQYLISGYRQISTNREISDRIWSLLDKYDLRGKL